MPVAQVWLPNMHLVSSPEEEKVLIVASTKCLCESPLVQQSQEFWAALRDAAVKRVQGAARGAEGLWVGESRHLLLLLPVGGVGVPAFPSYPHSTANWRCPKQHLPCR